MTTPIKLTTPHEGNELCYECDGGRACIYCDGTGEISGARCASCAGSGKCIVCGGAGELPTNDGARARAASWKPPG